MINESRYQKLSLFQTFFISVSALSVFDLGYSSFVSKGLRINYYLFHNDSYPDFITNNPLWGEFQFWGYCFVIVAICQLLKVIRFSDTKLFEFVNWTGLSAYLSFVGMHLLALILVVRSFDFSHHAFSSLVDYGFWPKLLTQWAMILSGSMLFIYLSYINYNETIRVLGLTDEFIVFIVSMMMIDIGLTSTNEIVDHGIYVQPMFIGLALLILSYSVRYFSLSKHYSPMLFGLVSLIVYAFVSFFSMGTIFLAEIVIGGLFSTWFLIFGLIYKKNKKSTNPLSTE